MALIRRMPYERQADRDQWQRALAKANLAPPQSP